MLSLQEQSSLNVSQNKASASVHVPGLKPLPMCLGLTLPMAFASVVQCAWVHGRQVKVVGCLWSETYMAKQRCSRPLRGCRTDHCERVRA